MRIHANNLVGVFGLILSSAATAQAEPPQKPVTPPTQSQTTTPQTTTTQPAGTPIDGSATPQSTAPGQTETTPGQVQTSPGQASEIAPAQTGQTPSAQPVPADQAQTSQLKAASADDVKSGASVYDQKGVLVGKIESVDKNGAVVSTGKARAAIPVTSFAKGDKGLVMTMTKAELEAAAKKK